MSTVKRVTSQELLALADQITKLCNRGEVSGVTNNLADAVQSVLAAVKTAAFNEAIATHRGSQP